MSKKLEPIGEFMGDLGVSQWKTMNDLEKVLERILSMNYSVLQASVKTKDGFVHTIGFTNTNKPFNQITLAKPEKTRLSALTKGVLKFIQEYGDVQEPQAAGEAL